MIPSHLRFRLLASTGQKTPPWGESFEPKWLRSAFFKDPEFLSKDPGASSKDPAGVEQVTGEAIWRDFLGSTKWP